MKGMLLRLLVPCHSSVLTGSQCSTEGLAALPPASASAGVGKASAPCTALRLKPGSIQPDNLD